MNKTALKYYQKLGSRTYSIYKNHRIWVTLLGFFLLAFVGAYIYYKRYPFAYTYSNFYAEDGKVFLGNILDHGPFGALFQLFNGYLIVGLYFVTIFAQIVNSIFGHGFETMAKAIAVSSYLFFGALCALPWLLFRRKLGTLLALITTVVLWATPMGVYDYAVIGTSGNLKFSFLFIAVLLVIFRNSKDLCSRKWQFVLIDISLLVCIFTNIVSVGLLPILLLRYKDEIREIIKKKKINLRILYKYDLLSLVALVLIGGAYVLFVEIHGVPKLPGYLDGPLDKSALIAIAYRSSTYGLFFPISHLFNNLFASITLIAMGSVFILKRTSRAVMLTLLYAMIINVIGFVANRPGVTELYTSYDDGTWPGLFFYAGTMMFVFGLAYLSISRFNGLTIRGQLLGLFVATFFTLLVLPVSGSRNDAYDHGTKRPTLSSEVSRICGGSTNENISKKVDIAIYPASSWTMSVSERTLCQK